MNTEASDWMPVTERLPEDSRMVLAYVSFRGDRHIARYVDKPNWGWMRRDYYKLEKVTHWQSLPKVPDESPHLLDKHSETVL